MFQHRLPTRVIAALLVSLLLVNGAFAAGSVVSQGPSPATNEQERLPVYMQLLIYVSDLMSRGEEVPKALLNKIAAYYKSGK